MFRRRHRSTISMVAALVLITAFFVHAPAQKSKAASSQLAKTNAAADDAGQQSEMRPIIEYYMADRGSLQRSFPVASSAARRERFRKFYSDALERIQKLDFDSMSQEGKVDYVLFKNH